MNDEDLAVMDASLGGVGGEVEQAYRYGFKAARANRWAAFTGDELLAITEGLALFKVGTYERIYLEADAEYQRRKAFANPQPSTSKVA